MMKMFRLSIHKHHWEYYDLIQKHTESETHDAISQPSIFGASNQIGFTKHPLDARNSSRCNATRALFVLFLIQAYTKSCNCPLRVHFSPNVLKSGRVRRRSLPLKWYYSTYACGNRHHCHDVNAAFLEFPA
jgi:hypothetical protein